MNIDLDKLVGIELADHESLLLDIQGNILKGHGREVVHLLLIEFTGALPRAKLFSNWQVSTNDTTTLQQLASTNFNPAQTMLVASEIPAAPDRSTATSAPIAVRAPATWAASASAANSCEREIACVIRRKKLPYQTNGL